VEVVQPTVILLVSLITVMYIYISLYHTFISSFEVGHSWSAFSEYINGL